MIKYKKPISIAKGGRSLSFANPETGRVTTVDIKENPPEDNVDQAYVSAPAVTLGSLGTGKAVWEWFKNWNVQSASAASNALPKTLSTIGKVAGPLGTAAMILTPAQTNVGEDELFRNPSSPFYRGRLVTESSDGQASEEQANESATTEEEAAASTVSNPQENPPEDPEKEESKKPRLSMRTIQKVLWETPKHNFKWLNDNTYTTPGVRNILVRVPAYGWGISSAGGVIPVVKNSGQYVYNKFINSPSPTTKLDSLKQKREELQAERQLLEEQRLLDSVQESIQPKRPVAFTYSDPTQNQRLQDSVTNLKRKIDAYGLGD